MRSQVRLLPHLGSLYQQQKSYQIHWQKIQNIKKSLSSSKKQLKNKDSLTLNQQDTNSQTFSNYSFKPHPNKNLDLHSNQPLSNFKKMQTIEEVKDMSYWMRKMTPLQKKIKQQQIKQNKRLKQRIKKSVSFIKTKNQIQNHQQKFDLIKSRLQKYHHQIIENAQDMSKTHEVSLKCQTVLKKLTQIEKEKMKIQESRIKVLSVSRGLTVAQNTPTSKDCKAENKNNVSSVKSSITTTRGNSRYPHPNFRTQDLKFLNKNQNNSIKKRITSRSSISYTTNNDIKEGTNNKQVTPSQIDKLSKINKINQIQVKMPFIHPRGRIKTQANEQFSKVSQGKSMMSRELINPSKLSKMSTKSYLSQKIPPINSVSSRKQQILQKIGFDKSKVKSRYMEPRNQLIASASHRIKISEKYDKEKNKNIVSLNNLNKINNEPNSKRSNKSGILIQKSSDLKRTIETKISSNSQIQKPHESKNKMIDFKRKKIERYYNYRNSNILKSNQDLLKNQIIFKNGMSIQKKDLQNTKTIQADSNNVNNQQKNQRGINCFATQIFTK